MVAQSLEELFPARIEEILGVLAHHWESADDPEQAVGYLQRAGDRARLAYALQEAADFYERAIRILKERDQLEHAARMLMRLGLTHLTAFDFKLSQTAYQEAFKIRQQQRRIRPASSVPAPHPYRFFWPETPPLNPPYIPTYETGMWIRNMFSGLVELGVEGEILPDVAEQWEVSEDGRKYVFHLREDAKWSDGQRVTAEDFEYAFMLLLHPDAEAASARDLFAIRNAKAFHQGEITDFSDVGIRAETPTTLEVELESSASHFLYLLANAIPVPKHVAMTQGESWATWENIVTNGPFMPGSFQPDEPILLVRNPDYHGRFPGNLEQAQITVSEYRRQADEFTQARLKQYRKGNIDIFAFGEKISQVRNHHADEYHSEPMPGLWFFALDPSRPPFDDSRVRRAFAHALDKGKMAEEIPQAYIYPANGGFIPPGIPGHSPGIAIPFDPTRARQLLADAGYPGGQGFPALQMVWVAENKKIESLLAQWRENLNVDVSLEVMQYEEAIAEIRKRQIYHMGWRASILDPDNFLRVCIREGLPAWEHDAYDKLIQKANDTLDQEERIQLYQSADKILVEEAVALPIDYAQAHFLVKPWVKIPVGRIEYTLLKDIVIEPH
jgi:oligopeptide transport system substrate-binding protein